MAERRYGQEQAPKVQRPPRPQRAPEAPPPSGGAAPKTTRSLITIIFGGR